MRAIGLDVHRDFCQVAMVEEGEIRSQTRIETTPEALGLFAESLSSGDQVALEATGNALAIARLLEPHVARVLLADPRTVKGIGQRGRKTDKVDAALLARLLASGFLPEIWRPDEKTVSLRRGLARRRQLVKQRTREKNQIHAVLARALKSRPPMSDAFGVAGRQWLDNQELPPPEQELVDASLRHIDFLNSEIGRLDRLVAEQVLASDEMRRLLQLPGFHATTAATLMAAIGDISRFPTPRHLVGYLGLNPTVRQSGVEPARHGRISKHGPGPVRAVLTEAAWIAARTTGPLRVFWRRTAARRGAKVATIAVARKLVVIAWHMLAHGEDYAFVRPVLVNEKIRTLELRVGAERRRGRRVGERVRVSPDRRRIEKELARQAEVAYERLIDDWQPRRRRAVDRA